MAIAEKVITVEKLEWFYREAQPTGDSNKLPILFLHGLPAQSYTWTQIMPDLAQQGFRSIAPDWIGYGSSTKPNQTDFAYTPDAFIKALTEFITALELDKFYLVIQGFLGSVGVQYALRNPDKIERLIILNAPISNAAKLPWKIKQMGLPLVGEMMTQDPLLVDRTLESGSKYNISDEDLKIYRQPFLKTSAAGRSLLATIRNLQLPAAMMEIETGFRQWQQSTLLLWGITDPWLPISQAEEIVKELANGELVKLPESGHYPQEHWSEKISQEISLFLRRKDI